MDMDGSSKIFVSYSVFMSKFNLVYFVAAHKALVTVPGTSEGEKVSRIKVDIQYYLGAHNFRDLVQRHGW